MIPPRTLNCRRDAIVKLLRQRIKYVFVIFNENHSFDNEYGTFPGVNGIYSDGLKPRSAGDTPGFTQTYTDVQRRDGHGPAVPDRTRAEFDRRRQRRPLAHRARDKDRRIVNGVAQMDKFAYDEYTRFASKGGAANEAKGTQFAALVMSHIDCDTIPFFWQWASRFTIFDNIFATEDTPSTPNAVAMIAGQSGETQWVKHGPNGQTYTRGQPTPARRRGRRLSNDHEPFYGSQFDTTTVNRQPTGAERETTPTTTSPRT